MEAYQDTNFFTLLFIIFISAGFTNNILLTRFL